MSNSSSATTVWLREDLADRLYARKSRGESYGDVIERLLDAAE
jgi:predicted CopG family antitoxin